MSSKNTDPTYVLQYKIIGQAGDLYETVGTLSHSDANAGIDLFCREDVEVRPGELAFLKLGVAAALYRQDSTAAVNNHSYHYWLLPRSSISKKGLMMANSVGVIDRTYRGELMGAVVVAPWRTEPVKVSRGERLFQVVAPDMGHIAAVVSVPELEATVRGAGGFGSTGN